MAVFICKEGLKKGIFAVGTKCRFPSLSCSGCLLGRKQKTVERAINPTHKDAEVLREKYVQGKNDKFSYKKKTRALGRKKRKAWQKDPQIKEKVELKRRQEANK